jgi:hypothetical protein
MKLGLLGTDSDIALLAAAAAARGDEVLALDQPGEQPGGPRQIGGDACDAIAVGSDGWDATRAEAVRMLVQTGRTLVLAQPLELSMLWAYELDMIRRDSGAILLPFLPARLHPFTARLKAAVESGVAGTSPLGPLESLRLERTMADRTRGTVLAALARDVDLVRVLVGEPARLATLGAGDPDSAWPTLAVGFTGPDQVPARWQVVPGSSAGLTIALQHATGAVSVHAPDEGDWTWSGPPAGTQPCDRGAVMLAALDETLALNPSSARPATAPAGALPIASWSDAARAIELADTVPRSLARGRAVDLHQEEFSEMSTFRGTMASVGCGLVLAALLVLILATIAAGIATAFDWEFGKMVVSAWPVLVLVVLSLFLVLQLLPFLIADRRREPPTGTPLSRDT